MCSGLDLISSCVAVTRKAHACKVWTWKGLRKPRAGFKVSVSPVLCVVSFGVEHADLGFCQISTTSSPAYIYGGSCFWNRQTVAKCYASSGGLYPSSPFSRAGEHPRDTPVYSAAADMYYWILSLFEAWTALVSGSQTTCTSTSDDLHGNVGIYSSLRSNTISLVLRNAFDRLSSNGKHRSRAPSRIPVRNPGKPGQQDQA